MKAADKNRLVAFFDLGFQLQVDDLRRSGQADVRMGTFIQAAAFIDALALAYSAPPLAVKGGLAGKWRRFVEDYFGPAYAPVAGAYGDFRCLLLHNFSASPALGFTHGEPHHTFVTRAGVRSSIAGRSSTRPLAPTRGSSATC